MLLGKSNDNDEDEGLDGEDGLMGGNIMGDDNIGQPFEMA